MLETTGVEEMPQLLVIHKLRTLGKALTKTWSLITEMAIPERHEELKRAHIVRWSTDFHLAIFFQEQQWLSSRSSAPNLINSALIQKKLTDREIIMAKDLALVSLLVFQNYFQSTHQRFAAAFLTTRAFHRRRNDTKASAQSAMIEQDDKAAQEVREWKISLQRRPLLFERMIT